MRVPLSLLGLTAQLPFQNPQISLGSMNTTTMPVPHRDAQYEFKFKQGTDVFSPNDLVELIRPGVGVANDVGDLVVVSTSQYSIADKKNKKAITIAPLESSIEPVEVTLNEGGQVFWLDSRTIGLAYTPEPAEGESKQLELHSLAINYELQTSILSASEPTTLIGVFPTTGATNFRFAAKAGYLVFSDYVYPDGNLLAVKEQDEAYETRGNSALVYDSTFERQWDTWVGPKSQSLFSVRLDKDATGSWVLGSEFVNLLKGTGHSSPVEPFGGTDDFDVSDTQVVYTTKDPSLPRAWHTKQDVHVVDIIGANKPKELTSGKQGATHSPVFSKRGDKAAWLELDEDGYEADRAKIVIYDLKKDVRFTLTQKWDRSPDALSFSEKGNFLYFTAGDAAKVKVFTIPVPPTPKHSSTHPSLPLKFTKPVAVTHFRAASGLQTLPNNRLIFSQSSFTSPNNVFIVRGLQKLEEAIEKQSDDTVEGEVEFAGESVQITHFAEAGLEGKKLSEGEEFYFKGADNKDVQGWVLKPRGWDGGVGKKYPVVLLIHGGPQGAWEDQWSNRWNPNIFAQQGYFVVAINPTGSTTFGQEFTDAIAEDWGGKPFVDMQKGWQYVLETYPEVDGDRAVAAGASWGGYAINWLQGHPEYGFNFKALVCHDGVFDANYNGYSTDELFFFNHEWGGRPWDSKSKALSEKYSPSNYVSKWSTPQLLIHGSKDYRLPETESIGAFHALQQLGIPSRLVIFPDENHWVLDHGNSLKWHYEVFRWFDQFVGDDE